MNRTNIEWTDYTWNPYTGCSRGCEYCFAYYMALRLRGRFGYPEDEPFKVTFHPNRLHEPSKLKKPSKIFTCSMGEIFDPEAQYGYIGLIFAEMLRNPRHTFQILTKQPEIILQFKYPSNLWVGISLDGKYTSFKGIDYLVDSDATVKFISFEPLLSECSPILDGVDWIIIGARTGRKPFTPPKSWVEHITDLAIKLDIPVFHKDNLGYGWLKEFPGRE